MKTAIRVAALAALLAIGLVAGLRSASAYPGGYCLNSSGCGRCEVCVKQQPTDPSGTCMKIAGCY